MIQANYKDKALVVDILTSAFENYTDANQINLVVGYGADRVQKMQVLMAYLFENAMLFGKVYLSDDKKGVLLLKFSEKEKTTLKTILLDIELAFKCIGLTNVPKVLKRQRLVKKNHPKEDHVSPMIFGVKPEVKGKLTAARLIQQVMRKHADNKLPIIIDTVSAYNLKLYQKFGFKIVRKEMSLDFPVYFLMKTVDGERQD